MNTKDAITEPAGKAGKAEKGSIGEVETRSYTMIAAGEVPLELDSGAVLAPVSVAYQTYGKLSPAADNAVLICHALSGSAHAAGFLPGGDAPGWWDDFIGPGKAFDTDRYYVICSNVLGGCNGTTGPSSVHPADGRPYGIRFPVVTIGDMVDVQRRLLDRLGVRRLLAVAGGSMGGMQAVEWTLRYPDAVRAALVIASTARVSAQNIAFNAVGRNSIITDPRWKGGNYYGGETPVEGLATARMIGHLTYLSAESMHRKFGRRLRAGERLSYELGNEFQVETYLDYQGDRFVRRFDANSYLYLTKAMDYFDPARVYGKGSLKAAFSRLRARVLVLSFSSDWLFPPEESGHMVEAMVHSRSDVSYVNLKTSGGHDAFLLEVEEESRLIRAFLASTYAKPEVTPTWP